MRLQSPDSLIPKTDSALSAGYTMARIKKLAGKPFDVRKHALSHSHHPESTIEPGSANLEMSEGEILKIEITHLTSLFVCEVWKKIHKWIKTHPPGIATLERYATTLSPISREELADILKYLEPAKAVDLLADCTGKISEILVPEWYVDQEKVLKEKEDVVEEEEKIWAAYRRYKKILTLGTANVKERDKGKRIESVDKHLWGGFVTAEGVIWRCFKILPEVFEEQYGRPITKEELKTLVTGTHPLVLAIASTSVNVLTATQLELVESTNNNNRIKDIRDRDFKPSKFSISKNGNNLYLEIKPDILDKIEKRVQDSQNANFLHTGCPALFAEGVEGKNVVSELFTWFAEVYEEFFINARNEYK